MVLGRTGERRIMSIESPRSLGRFWRAIDIEIMELERHRGVTFITN